MLKPEIRTARKEEELFPGKDRSPVLSKSRGSIRGRNQGTHGNLFGKFFCS